MLASLYSIATRTRRPAADRRAVAERSGPAPWPPPQSERPAQSLRLSWLRLASWLGMLVACLALWAVILRTIVSLIR